MTNARIILSTVDSLPAAEIMARTLVESSLAACVNIIPGLRSIYWWKEAVHDAPELLLIIKTSSDKIGEAINKLVEIHPYELPEAIVLDIDSGHAPYLEWIASASGGKGQPAGK